MEHYSSYDPHGIYDTNAVEITKQKDTGPVVLASLDLEMSNLDQKTGGILQIGFWATGEDEGVLRGYYCVDVNPENVGNGKPSRTIVYNPKSMAINKISPERIQRGLSVYDALRGLVQEFQRYQGTRIVLIGSSIAQDIEWLHYSLKRAGLSLPLFDLVEIKDLTELLWGKRLSLNKAASMVGLRNGRRHDALADAWCGAMTGHRLGKLLRERGREPW